MANFIERNLPGPLRNKLQTLIAAALGLFLGLRYNDYFRKLIANFLPDAEGLLWEGLILIGLTLIIVGLSVLIEKGLDGK